MWWTGEGTFEESPFTARPDHRGTWCIQFNAAQLTLSTAWHGDAADQFATYAGMAKPILTQNQTSLVALTKTMSSIAQTIIDTYKTCSS